MNDKEFYKEGIGLTNGHGITNRSGLLNDTIRYSTKPRANNIIYPIVLSFIIIFSGFFYFFMHEATTSSTIKIDGNSNDWLNKDRFKDSDDYMIQNLNIDIATVSLNVDSVYLSLYVETKEPFFTSDSVNHLNILVDADDNSGTGFLSMGIGTEYMVEVLGSNQLTLSSLLYNYKADDNSLGISNFKVLSDIKAIHRNTFIELQVPLFDLGLKRHSSFLVGLGSADTYGNFDNFDYIIDSNLNTMSVKDRVRDLQKEHNGYFNSGDPIIVDGKFGDWSDSLKYVDNFDEVSNLNIDLRQYSRQIYGTETYYYINV